MSSLFQALACGRLISSIGGHQCDHAPCSSKLLLTSAMSWFSRIFVSISASLLSSSSLYVAVAALVVLGPAAPSISCVCSTERSTTRKSCTDWWRPSKSCLDLPWKLAWSCVALWYRSEACWMVFICSGQYGWCICQVYMINSPIRPQCSRRAEIPSNTPSKSSYSRIHFDSSPSSCWENTICTS